MRYMVRTVAWDQRRLDNIEKLREQIPHLEVLVDYHHDSYLSFMKACHLINATGAVLLEDDVELCSGFIQRIEVVIHNVGIGQVINFFEKPKKYFKSGIVGGSNFLWMQCVYLPAGLPDIIAGYHDEFCDTQPEKYKGMATDCLIQYALVKQRLKYYRYRPCLVQHLDFPSVIGHRPNNRQSPYYIELLKQRGISYEEAGNEPKTP